MRLSTTRRDDKPFQVKPNQDSVGSIVVLHVAIILRPETFLHVCGEFNALLPTSCGWKGTLINHRQHECHQRLRRLRERYWKQNEIHFDLHISFVLIFFYVFSLKSFMLLQQKRWFERGRMYFLLPQLFPRRRLKLLRSSIEKRSHVKQLTTLCTYSLITIHVFLYLQGKVQGNTVYWSKLSFDWFI